MLPEQGSSNLVQDTGHKGPVLRPRCIRPGRARIQILFIRCQSTLFLPHVEETEGSVVLLVVVVGVVADVVVMLGGGGGGRSIVLLVPLFVVDVKIVVIIVVVLVKVTVCPAWNVMKT